MGWHPFKKSGGSKRKRNKASDDKKKTSGNSQTVDNKSDGEKSQSERFHRGKKHSTMASSPSIYTPVKPEVISKKRHQQATSSSDSSFGNMPKEDGADVPSKRLKNKKPLRVSELSVYSGPIDASSKKQRRTKTRQNKSVNKSMMQVTSEKEGKQSKRMNVGSKKSAKQSSRRSTERVFPKLKRDGSAKKQSNRKKKWPKKTDRTVEMTTIENTEDQKPNSVTPGKEISVMNKTEELKPTSVMNKTEEFKPTSEAPIEDKQTKEVNIDDDCLTELKTCSLLRSPVPNKRHISPLHKNKTTQID